MIEMLKQLGSVWVREMQATLAGRIFTVLLGYIIREDGVAQPYMAAVDGALTEEEHQQLRQTLMLSKPAVIGERGNHNWEWQTWDGEKLASPPVITSPKQAMEREADFHLVFLHLFASIQGLPPNIIRELVNAALLTRIYLQEINADQEWDKLLENPGKFTVHALKALRLMKVEQIAFIPYVNSDIVKKLVLHTQVLPLQALNLAKSYLAYSLIALREEFGLTMSPSYWVQDILENMKHKQMLKGEVADLSSLFSSKLIYCADQDISTALVGIEESAHFITQAKMFALLSGDERMEIREVWTKDFQADTVFAEMNSDNVFRLVKETSLTLRPNGYGCWVMDAKLEALTTALLGTDRSNYEIKEVYHYESTNLGNWVAIIFYKPEGGIVC